MDMVDFHIQKVKKKILNFLLFKKKMDEVDLGLSIAAGICLFLAGTACIYGILCQRKNQLKVSKSTENLMKLEEQ